MKTSRLSSAVFPHLLALVVSLFVTAAALAQSAEGLSLRDAVGEKSYPSAPRLAQQVTIEPAFTLDTVARAMPEKVQEIEDWNASGHVPARNGVIRPFVDPVNVQIAYSPFAAKSGPVPLGRGVVATTSRGIVWSGNVKVDGASRLRLHLSNVNIPDGAVLWVYGGNDVRAFGRELIDPTGGLWTPSAWGDTIHLEIEVPSGTTASFAIDEVLELLDSQRSAGGLRPEPNETDTSCLFDVTCVTASDSPLPLANVRRAIAQMTFMAIDKEDGVRKSFVCSGGLVNDANDSGTPYFLTANHCISDQTAASSLEAHFDWSYVSCTSNDFPPLSSVPKSNGSTLLVTKDDSDVTLLRLNSVPPNRYFLSWTADRGAIGAGTTIYRVSHPAPDGAAQPQQYSQTVITSTGGCGVSTTDFIFSTVDVGGTFGGSSGSPVMLADGRVVGQLNGRCGNKDAPNCDPSLLKMDGAFASSYPLLKPYLDPQTGGTGGCSANETTLCLNDNRFRVTSTWRTDDGKTGNGQAVPLTGDTGYFWFFGSSNVEMVVKAIDGCNTNNKYWVFAGGLTSVGVTLNVTDTKTGAVRTYTNPLGAAFQPIQDTSAFSCP